MCIVLHKTYTTVQGRKLEVDGDPMASFFSIKDCAFEVLTAHENYKTDLVLLNGERIRKSKII